MELLKRNEEMRDFFNEKADGYDDVHLKMMDNKIAITALLPEKVERVLDLGAGTGLELIPLFERFPQAHVTVVDISAEMLKKKIGTAVAGIDRGSAQVCGRDLRTGLATTIEVTTDEVRAAISDPLSEIVSMVKMTLESTPPELSADIFDFGIVMVGGGALLPGIDQAIHDRTGIRVIVPKRPKDCVCVGLGRMIQSTGGDFSEFIRYKVK